MQRSQSHHYTPKRSILSAIAAFLGYGSWSAYANYDHGMDIATKILLIYGTYSAIATLAYSSIMEFIYSQAHPRKIAAGLTLLITCALMYSTTVAVNIIAETPELLLTITPGIIISTFFALGYVKVLSGVYLHSQTIADSD